MNIKALITSLVLGTSSVALAAPSLVVSGGASVTLSSGYKAPVADPCDSPAPVAQPIVYRPQPVVLPWFNPTNTSVNSKWSVYTGSFGHAPMYLQTRNDTRWFRPAPATWFNFTEPTRIDNGAEYFNVKRQAGLFHELQLKDLGGRTGIEEVMIEYKQPNGTSIDQKVYPNESLSTGGAITIQLQRDSRSIQRIIVYGHSSRGSAFQILAK
jgi:hypothetical protein